MRDTRLDAILLPSWGHLEANEDRTGTILGPSGDMKTLILHWVFLHVRHIYAMKAVLLYSSGVVWTLTAILAHLGPSWRHLGPSWDHLRALSAPLGALLGHLGPLLALSWPLLGPSWALLGRSWSRHGAILGHVSAILAPSWPQGPAMYENVRKPPFS